MKRLESLLGLRTALLDQIDTWSIRVGPDRSRDRALAVIWFYVVPFVTASMFLLWRVNLRGVAQLLAGVSVFTALLFGLLFLVFNTAVAVKKDRALVVDAHDVQQLLRDLRANITYTAIIAMLLAVSLVVAAATASSSQVLCWGWTTPLTFLGMHLVLNLLTILKRFRTAFNFLTR